MKIWHGHGSEHSAALVMIGQFTSPEDAQSMVARLDQIREFAQEEDQRDGIFGARRYSDSMLQFVSKANVTMVQPHEFEQFLMEIDWRTDSGQVVVETEEYDVSALLKLFIVAGAKVEVYSRHDVSEPAARESEE